MSKPIHCSRCGSLELFPDPGQTVCAACLLDDETVQLRAKLDVARAEVERLREESAEFRRKVEAMPNTIISRRAKRHVLAALGGER